LLVPRSAINDGQHVYVFQPDDENPGQGRLVLKRVPLLRSVGDRILVDFAAKSTSRVIDDQEAKSACELKAGDRIIVSPLPKAVPGMRLALRNQPPSDNAEQPIAETRRHQMPARMAVAAARQNHERRPPIR